MSATVMGRFPGECDGWTFPASRETFGAAPALRLVSEALLISPTSSTSSLGFPVPSGSRQDSQRASRHCSSVARRSDAPVGNHTYGAARYGLAPACHQLRLASRA